VVALGAFASQAAPAHAGQASLLLDIDQGGVGGAVAEVHGELFSLGPVALATIFLEDSGQELWATDGTGAGTRLVLDLCPGPCSSHFTPVGTVGQVGIFSASTDADGAREWHLWRSDGTRPGTFPLTVSPGGALQSCGGGAAPAGSVLLFSARLAGGTCGLWKTDGTVAGTVKLRDEDGGSLTAAGGLVFFTVFNLTGHWELWRSDGTPDGTVLLRQVDQPQDLFASGSRLFFTALVSTALDHGRELWTSDGTAAGTVPLTQFAAADPFVHASEFSSAAVMQDAGGLACFLVDDSVAGRELWCSDGTVAGTRPATSMTVASPFVGLASWRVERIGGRLLFPANDGLHGNRWWTSDGRAESMAPLSGCPGGCPEVDAGSPLARAGENVFFAAPGEGPVDPNHPRTTDLWVTDGTGAGTRRLRDFCNDCRVDRMFPILGKLFFSLGQRFSLDDDLWASDGTPQGTRLLLRQGAFSDKTFPIAPVAVGKRALLAQKTGLWMSDGTPEGTDEVAFLAASNSGSSPALLVPTRDGVRFLASDENHRLVWASRGTNATTTPLLNPGFQVASMTAYGDLTLFESQFPDALLWRTDGTVAGTFPLTPDGLLLSRPVVVGSQALFTARGLDGSNSSLWATDGTVAGTHVVFELPQPAGILPVETSAVITAGTVLWRTDGTAAGTHEIPLPPFFQLAGNNVEQLGSALFFHGYGDNGDKLWRSEGTPGTAQPFADAILGPPESFAVRAGALYILAYIKGSGTQSALFRSDGTDAGTVLLMTLPRRTTSAPDLTSFTAVGNLVYFSLEDSRGRELWRTDGTPAGTLLVRDIVPGPESSWPSQLTALNGRLYFTATIPGLGTELWESDGTEAGTRLVQDIAPGILSSAPEELVASGGRLFFTADDGVHGREPWIYVPDEAACELTETSLCLGGRFRVEADWSTSAALSGPGHAVALTADTGYFWFFDPSNVEVLLKVLDGQGVNGHYWVFYGALSNVEYSLTVTDTLTGASRRYANPSGRLGSVADTTAFGPLGASASRAFTVGPAASTLGETLVTTRSVAEAGSCAASPTRLCLDGGRFAVEARWKDFQGHTGIGQAVPLSGDTGTFWFFDASNVEVVLKVLDGRPANGKFWVFYGALSNVEYTLTVTDMQTGIEKTYINPLGRLASVADTGAF
jgi:ELWxxDGT repeat protein